MGNDYIKQWNDQVNNIAKVRSNDRDVSIEQIIKPGSVQVLNDEGINRQQAREINNLNNALANAGLV